MITGESMRAIRRIRKTSQVQLSQETKIPQPYISMMEQGKWIITQEQEKVIIEALGLSEQQSEEITNLVEHINDAKQIEEICWSRIRQALQP